MDCVICRRLRGEAPDWGGAIYEDDLVVADHCPPEEGEGDVYLGRLLVKPRRHAPSVADLHEAEALAVGLWISRLARALRAAGAEHVYVFVLGHRVPHAHFHLIPRHPGTPAEYWGFRVLEWPAAPRGREAEVSAFCDRLRKELHGHR